MASIQLAVIGASNVGKSALTTQFVQKKFPERYDPTIEDTYRMQVEIDNEAVCLDIMDTAGQEEYVCLTDVFVKNAAGCLLVYSITSRKSFENVQKDRDRVLRTKMSRHPHGDASFPFVMVGNKKDLETTGPREVSTQEAQDLANKLKIPLLEASALTSYNVTEAFHRLVREIFAWRKTHPHWEKNEQRRLCIII